MDDSRVTRLHEGVTRLQGCSSTAEILDQSLTAATEILGFDWCAIALVRDGMFEIAGVSDSAPVAVGDRHLAVDEGVAGRAFASGESVVLDDAADTGSGAEPVHRSFRSALTVPIEGYGVFQGTAGEPGVYDDEDLRLAELLVAHTTEALRRVERGSTLRERETELEAQNERLERFASVVSHDLRNPLQVASGNVGLAMEATTDPTVEDRLETVDDALDRISRIVDDVLQLARTGATATDTERTALDELVEAAWATAGHEAVQFERESLGTVDCDPVTTRRLFENLFANAVEHGAGIAPGSEGRPAGDTGGGVPGDGAALTVHVGRTDEGVYVADDGPGIPESDREAVFEPGYSSNLAGTGLGLSIVREVADAHGWTVTAGESREGGARFDVGFGGA